MSVFKGRCKICRQAVWWRRNERGRFLPPYGDEQCSRWHRDTCGLESARASTVPLHVPANANLEANAEHYVPVAAAASRPLVVPSPVLPAATDSGRPLSLQIALHQLAAIQEQLTSLTNAWKNPL